MDFRSFSRAGRNRFALIFWFFLVKQKEQEKNRFALHFFGNDKKVRTAKSKSKTSFPILGKSINKSGNRIATTGQALSLQLHPAEFCGRSSPANTWGWCFGTTGFSFAATSWSH
jgi:hypothetical protein